MWYKTKDCVGIFRNRHVHHSSAIANAFLTAPSFAAILFAGNQDTRVVHVYRDGFLDNLGLGRESSRAAEKVLFPGVADSNFDAELVVA